MGIFQEFKSAGEPGSPLADQDFEAQAEAVINQIRSESPQAGIKMLWELPFLDQGPVAYAIGTTLIKLLSEIKQDRIPLLKAVIQLYKLSLEANPASGDAWIMKGLAHAYLGGELRASLEQDATLLKRVRLRDQLQAALAAWEEGLKIQPEFEGTVASMTQEIEKALSVLDPRLNEALAMEGTSLDEVREVLVLQDEGEALIEARDWSGALDFFERTTLQDHYLTQYGKGLARLQLARESLDLSVMEPIIPLFDAVLEQKQDWASPWYFRGMAHFRTAELIFAREAETKGEKTDDARMIHHFQACVEDMKRALELAPELEERARKYLQTAAERVAILKGLNSNNA